MIVTAHCSTATMRTMTKPTADRSAMLVSFSKTWSRDKMVSRSTFTATRPAHTTRHNHGTTTLYCHPSVQLLPANVARNCRCAFAEEQTTAVCVRGSAESVTHRSRAVPNDAAIIGTWRKMLVRRLNARYPADRSLRWKRCTYTASNAICARQSTTVPFNEPPGRTTSQRPHAGTSTYHHRDAGVNYKHVRALQWHVHAEHTRVTHPGPAATSSVTTTPPQPRPTLSSK